MRIPFLLFLIFLVFIIAPSANAGGLYHHHYCPVEMLHDEDPVVRTEAVVALGERGSDAAWAIPALIDALDDEDWIVVQAAYDALTQMGRIAEPDLIEALYSGSENKVSYGGYILSQMKPLSSRTVFAFMDNFENHYTGGWLIRALADASGDYDFITDAAIRRLGSNESRIRERAIKTLGYIGPRAKEGAPLLIDILKGMEPAVSWTSLENPMDITSSSYIQSGENRASTAWALSRIGADVDDVLPLIFDYLWLQRGYDFVPEDVIPRFHPDLADLVQRIRAKIVETGDSGFADEVLLAYGAEATPWLYEFLESDNDVLSETAAKVLGEIRPVSDETVRALVAAQENGNSGALRSLAELGPEYSEITLPIIIEAYESDDPEIRLASVASIPKYGRAGWDAIPVFFKAVDDSNGQIADAAYFIMSEMGPPYPDEIIDKLITRLNHPFAVHRKEAAYSLRHIGPYAIRAEDKLIARLDDWDKDVQENAIEALIAIHLDGSKIIPVFKDKLKAGKDLTYHDFKAINKMGPDAAGLTDELIGFLKDADDPGLRFNAAVSLGKIGFQARRAAPFFWDILRDDEQVNLHPAASVALERFGEFKPEIIDILLNDMKTVESGERYRCITALGEIGPDAAAAVPELLRIIGEGSWDTDDAVKAIGLIGYAAPGAVTRLNIYAELGELAVLDADFALFKLGDDPEYHLQRLFDTLGSDKNLIKALAIRHLGWIGPPAKAAIPCLREIEVGDDEWGILREAVWEALPLIEGKN